MGPLAVPMRGRRRGAARLALFLTLLAAGLALFLLTRPVEREARDDGTSSTPPPELETPQRTAVPPRPENASAAPGESRDATTPPADGRPFDDLRLGGRAPDTEGEIEPRFRGRGTLRGRIEPDGARPAVWTLVVEPSRVLAGREHAQARTLEISDGSLEFTLEDLPYGAYDLIPEAPGRSGLRTPVVLDAGTPEAYVLLRLLEAARLAGRVVDHEGLPAAELLLTLVRNDDRTERTATTDALGGFRFEGLADGAYDLVVGSPLAPTIAPRTLRITAPGMTLPDLELPPLATLHVVLAAGEDQRLLTDGEVRASSPAGGSFEGTTNAYGRVSGTWLKPGRWRVRSSCEGYRSRRDTVDLAPGEERTLALELYPSQP